MKTKLFAALTAVAILICLAVPALGAPTLAPIWDTLYFVENFDGFTTYGFFLDNYLDSCEWYVTDDFGVTVSSGVGREIEFPGAEDTRFSIYFRLPDNLIDANTFPVGSQFSLEVAYFMNFARDNDSLSADVAYYHVGDDGSIIGEDVYGLSVTDTSMESTDDDPIVSSRTLYESGFFFEFCLRVETLNIGPKVLNLDWADFSVTVNDSLFSQNVDQQIIDKIDQIINGEVPPPRDPSGGIGEDLDDAEDQLMDGAQQGLQDFTNYTQGFLAWLTGSATAFVAAGTLLGVILEVQMYNDLLFASLTLGSFALLLGAAITIFKRRE